jgi:hypothetical protein
MPWWPGWDSIESTDFWNTFWFWFGIGCLFLLGASEVVSHYYGQRHNTLVASAERKAASERQQEQEQAEQRHAAELAETQRRVEETRRQQAPRRLTEDQKRSLVAALSPFAGQKFKLEYGMGNNEAANYAADFMDVFRNAKWVDVGNSPIQAIWTGPGSVGIEVTLNQEEADKGAVPRAAFVLIETLGRLGLADHAGFKNPQVPSQTIEFRIGAKPPPP